MFEAVGAYKAGMIDDAQLEDCTCNCCPGCGSCSGMYTANSMNCLNEAIGLALPGNGTVIATHRNREQYSYKLPDKSWRTAGLITKTAMKAYCPVTSLLARHSSMR